MLGSERPVSLHMDSLIFDALGQSQYAQDDNGAAAAAGPVRDVVGASGIEEDEDEEDGDEGYERRGADGRDVSSDLADMGL